MPHLRITPFLVCAGLLAGTASAAEDKASMQLHQSMAKNMQQMQSMPMSGDVDKDFAMMMKHHHQSGIEMAQIQAKNGKDPEMRKQAQKIIESQKKEIGELDRWLQTKGGASAGSSGKPGSPQSQSSGSTEHSGHSGGK